MAKKAAAARTIGRDAPDGLSSDKSTAGSPSWSGVGESKRFGGVPQDLTDPRHPANCTMRGEAIPENMWEQIPYSWTDQGAAENGLSEGTSRVSVTRDELHGQIGQRGFDLDRGMGIEAHDPMRSLADEFTPPGMRPLFMSKSQVDKEGTTRGYKVATKANGDPVMLGTLILGYIPEEKAAAIQRGFERKSDEAQKEMYGDDFDPRTNGRGARSVTLTPGTHNSFDRIAKQGELSRGAGPSHSFDNPDPTGDDVGLPGDTGEDFSL